MQCVANWMIYLLSFVHTLSSSESVIFLLDRASSGLCLARLNRHYWSSTVVNVRHGNSTFVEKMHSRWELFMTSKCFSIILRQISANNGNISSWMHHSQLQALQSASSVWLSTILLILQQRKKTLWLCLSLSNSY